VQPDQLERLCAGEPAAQRSVSEHFGRLLRLKVRLHSRGRDRGYVEDVVQETFARVFRAVRDGKVQHLARFGAFVHGVCDNVLHEFERADARLRPVENVPEAAAPDDPEADSIAREAFARAEEVLRTLPERDRQILRLLLVEEADKDEICQRFGVNRDHLRVIVHRAKERFRNASRTMPPRRNAHG
jgi:RNA polymerase sigma-70 factor (ECF subfamily)